MSRRTGLGRKGSRFDEDPGDPLDGLVNLFDLGIVLAVAFLVAGLGLSVDAKSGKLMPRQGAAGETQRTLEQQDLGKVTSGKGSRVGSLYRLPDGRLVVVEPGQKPVR